MIALTPREREVLCKIAHGDSNKEIATSLCICVKTVEKHRQSLINKTNLRNAATLTRYAFGLGIVTPIYL